MDNKNHEQLSVTLTRPQADVLVQLLDYALKGGGIRVLDAVSEMLGVLRSAASSTHSGTVIDGDSGSE